MKKINTLIQTLLNHFNEDGLTKKRYGLGYLEPLPDENGIIDSYTIYIYTLSNAKVIGTLYIDGNCELCYDLKIDEGLTVSQVIVNALSKSLDEVNE